MDRRPCHQCDFSRKKHGLVFPQSTPQSYVLLRWRLRPPLVCFRLCHSPRYQLTPLAPSASILRCLFLLSACASLLCCRLLLCVHWRTYLHLLLCLHLWSHLCLALPSSRLVGCRISQHLSLSLSSRLHPAPWPPPFITPPPFIAPLSFGWLSRCPAPQPSSCRNSAWCLGLHLLLHPCL